MYRTSGAVTEEIVLERRSRPRVRLAPVVLFVSAFGAMGAMAVINAQDHWLAAQVTLAAFAVAGMIAIFVRTQKLMVVRAGRELRIRDGRARQSVLVGEVLDVDIDTRAENAHAVVFVLRDGRRIGIGEPREYMRDAVSDRRAIRDVLTRP